MIRKSQQTYKRNKDGDRVSYPPVRTFRKHSEYFPHPARLVSHTGFQGDINAIGILGTVHRYKFNQALKPICKLSIWGKVTLEPGDRCMFWDFDDIGIEILFYCLGGTWSRRKPEAWTQYRLKPLEEGVSSDSRKLKLPNQGTSWFRNTSHAIAFILSSSTRFGSDYIQNTGKMVKRVKLGMKSGKSKFGSICQTWKSACERRGWLQACSIRSLCVLVAFSHSFCFEDEIISSLRAQNMLC